MEKLLYLNPAMEMDDIRRLTSALFDKGLFGEPFRDDLLGLKFSLPMQKVLFGRLIEEGDGETYKIFKDVLSKGEFDRVMRKLEGIEQRDVRLSWSSRNPDWKNKWLNS